MKECRLCKATLSHSQYVYCSNRCQIDYQYEQYIKKWILDSKRGEKVPITKNISKYIKRYLLEKNDEKCSLCGWNKQHPFTKKVPLEVDHCDGNAENNNINNLRLLCPNCHALTPHFRNLNKGNGRKWR